MGGFGGLFAGLSRGFGGRLLQRSDEEREAARKQYEHEISMLESVGLNPQTDPEDAQAALRLASERHNAYLKKTGQNIKDIPDFYGTLADMMKGRGGTTAATTAGENPNQPSMDTGVPNLFSHQGDYMAQAAPAQGAAPMAAPAAQPSGYGGIYRDPVAEKMRGERALGAYEDERKQTDMARRQAAIDAEVNAGRMTPEAGARAKAALQVGFPLPAERTAQPKYDLFTNDRGQVEYVPEGSKIPAGYKPYEKGTAPRSGSFQARYADKLAEIQASNPGIGETDAHQKVMASLEQEDAQNKAEKELDLKLKKGRLAALGKSLEKTTKAKGMTAAQAGTILRAAQADAAKMRSDLLGSAAAPKDPAAAQKYYADLEGRVSERLASYVEEVFGMTLEDVQAIAQGQEPGAADDYIKAMTGTK